MLRRQAAVPLVFAAFAFSVLDLNSRPQICQNCPVYLHCTSGNKPPKMRPRDLGWQSPRLGFDESPRFRAEPATQKLQCVLMCLFTYGMYAFVCHEISGPTLTGDQRSATDVGGTTAQERGMRWFSCWNS